MRSITQTPQRKEDIYARQIAFVAAFLLPAAKLLEAPSILSQYATGDLLLPAILHALLQSLILLAILYAASRSEISLHERLKGWLGKGIYVLYILYAAYFVFAAVLPILDMEKFVYAAFFDTAPTTFSFGFFFFFSAFVCVKGIKAIGRSADLCLFLFLLPFLALLVMSLTAADFSNLMPLFGTKFSNVVTAFQRSTPHFSDGILLLPLIANLSYKRRDGVKIMSGYWAGSMFTLLFLAVFYAVFSTIAPREHYAFLKVAQYFPALSVVGRIDLLFIYLLSIVLLLYTCLPLQYSVQLICNTIHTERKTYVSAILNFLLLVAAFLLNRFYDRFYAFFSRKLFFIFILIADMVPLFLLFLPKNKGQTPRSNPDRKSTVKEETSYA